MESSSNEIDIEKESLKQEVSKLKRKLIRSREENARLSQLLNSNQSTDEPSKSIDHKQNQASAQDISQLIENEISSFSEFSKTIIQRNQENLEMEEAFETINQLVNDSHLLLQDKISPFFAAIRSFVISSIPHNEPSDDNQLQKQIYELKKQLKKSQHKVTFLTNQIISEHEQIANFSKQFDPSALKKINDTTFIEREIEILSKCIDVKAIRQLIEKNFGQIRPNRSTLPELLSYAFLKLQEVDDFIQKMKIAFEMDSEDVDFDTLLNCLQEHLSIIPKVQSSLSQLESEKEALEKHCDELEGIIKKQSEDFNNSHKTVVKQLQNKIKELQERNSDKKLEEMTKVVMDNDTDQYNFSILQRKYEEVSKTYQSCLQKLIDEQNLTRDLKSQLVQKDQQIKDFKDELNSRLSQSIDEIEQEQKSGIEELTKMSQRSFEELQQAKKKAKKYQTQLRDSEMSIRDLETKVDNLSEITESQSSKLNELNAKLKKKKMAYSKLSKEYSEFQQTHLQVVSKLATAQSEIKALKRQNEMLNKEVVENKASIEFFEKEMCSKSELDKCYHEVQDKEKQIEEMQKMIAKQTSLLSSFEQRQSILEEYKSKYSEEHESLNKQQKIVSDMLKNVKNIHSYFTSHVQSKTNVSPLFIDLLKLIKPLFDSFSLPTYSFDYIRPLSLNFVKMRVASFRPNSESDFLTSEDKVILKRVNEEIDDFPKDESNYIQKHNSLLTLSENLIFILESIIRFKRIFNERNESLNTLTNLVKNQQSAILRMTHSPTSPK